jgi:hypothetical protein
MTWNTRVSPRFILHVGVAAVVAGLAALPAAGQAPPPGKASGAVTIDGKDLTLRYAYAWVEPSAFDPDRTDTVSRACWRSAGASSISCSSASTTPER